jgi:DNA-binding NarL/FixJ family response regulator
VIFLSAFFHDRYIEEALEAGASGYVTKNEAPGSLLSAIRKVSSGFTYFSPEVHERLVVDVSGLRLRSESHTRGFSLTDRETETLRYVAQGLAKREIANIMHLSVRTVDAHVRNLMAKLDIHDRVELARFAIREGLAEA